MPCFWVTRNPRLENDPEFDQYSAGLVERQSKAYVKDLQFGQVQVQLGSYIFPASVLFVRSMRIRNCRHKTVHLQDTHKMGLVNTCITDPHGGHLIQD